MVSEGVDMPRLAVGVYATSVSTPLFFAQAVGRFVRARKRGETASVFLPSVPALLGFAAELEAERDHVLRHLDEDARGRTRRGPAGAQDPGRHGAPRPAVRGAQGLGARSTGCCSTAASSAPRPRRAPRKRRTILGLPGLLEPDQVTTLLRKRQAAQLAARSAAAAAKAVLPGEGEPADGGLFAGPAASRLAAKEPERTAPTVSREQLGALRKELNGLVGAWSHRTGQPHGVIHNELRNSCGGPALPQASAEQIRTRIDKIRQWALSRR